MIYIMSGTRVSRGERLAVIHVFQAMIVVGLGMVFGSDQPADLEKAIEDSDHTIIKCKNNQ
jgi:hypothetical protein